MFKSSLFKGLPKRFKVFQWHGDTFSIPKECVHLVEFKACQNHAFSCNSSKIVTLQFHLELTMKYIHDLRDNCKSKLVPAAYIQMDLLNLYAE
ncbi:MAG: glutamine amidotransferase-related protein [Promethearchaeota archaeon]